jgi:hypothetical protein
LVEKVAVYVVSGYVDGGYDSLVGMNSEYGSAAYGSKGSAAMLCG